VYRKPANGGGTAELLYESATATIPMAWAPDGQAIVLVNYATVAQDLWILPLSGDRQPKVYLQTPMAKAHPQISPDGRWISYTSFSTSRVGMREVWVQSYPVPGIKYQVPLAYARQARWRADGKELIVVTSDALTAVPIESKGSALAFGPPTELFKGTPAAWAHRTEGQNYFSYDVSADGQTFVLPRELAQGGTAGVRPPMTAILNWRSLLGKK
jgi:Tol biopolymer transport system component